MGHEGDIIDVGEPVVLYGTFLTASHALFNPSSVTLTITKPDGTTTVVGPAAGPPYGPFDEISTGRISYTIAAVDQAGVWSYEWEPAGGAIQSSHFLVGKTGDVSGPCTDWCRPEDLFSCSPASAVPSADRDWAAAAEAVAVASSWLFKLSGRKYPGICHSTVRPCRSCPGCGAMSYGHCSCGGNMDELALTGTHRVLGVVAVRIDGQVFPASSYRVDDDRWLVRTDGDVWPTWQDWSADPASDVDTFVVEYYHGALPPPDGRAAAHKVAAEVYAACVGLECKLPANVTQLIRQGIAINLADITQMPDLLGLREVDRFLNSERYAESNGASFIIDPEGMAATRRVNT